MKDVQEAIQPGEEHFSGQHLLGWLMPAKEELNLSILARIGSLISE